MNRFVIADMHLGHTKVLNFEPTRPGCNITEHNEILINNWNSVVGARDIVFVLGDVVFGVANLHLLGELNGDKRLIMGNHDCYATKRYTQYFSKLYGSLRYHQAIMTHIPIHPQQLHTRYKYNIHGHLHSKTLNDGRYICVSVEHTNFYPVNLDALLDMKGS